MADERRIDAAVRAVPLPDGLADRLAVESLFDDAALDRVLTRVAVPEGLADRVRNAACAAESGRTVNRNLAPRFLPAAAGRHARGGGSATLPAVAIAVAAVACLVIVVLESGRPFERAGGGSVVVLAATEPAPIGAADVPVGMLADDEPPSLDPLEPRLVVDDAIDQTGTELAVDGPDERLVARPAAPTVRGAAVGAAGPPARSGGMHTVAVHRSESRRAVPRVAGFDLAFEITHGEPPFIDPRAAGLAVDRPPLVVDTGSFDLLVPARRKHAGGGPAGALRTEEILAALPAADRPRDGGPVVTVRGVQSLRGRHGTFLVEVGVAAPPLARGPGGRLDAVLALDRYAGSEPLVWPRMCRAAEAVAAQMRPGDQVTLVVGGRSPRAVGERLDADGLRRRARELAATSAEVIADFDATMRAALAEIKSSARPLVVVASVESVDRARGEGRDAVNAWLAAAARLGPEADGTATRFVLVDPTEGHVRAPAEPGFGRTPAAAHEMSRAVLAWVFGVPTLALRQARLDVAFDPRVVAAYRLVGHRQSAMESLSPAPERAIDLHAGESARVVYEVVPRAADGTALKATLTCRPVTAAGEQVFTAAFPVRAIESGPVPSPHGCELLLAVALGEIASGSPHAGPRSASIDAVTNLATAWRARGDVTAAGTAILDACTALGILKPSQPGPGSRR